MPTIEELISLYREKAARKRCRYLGWTCIYTPEELITATGLVPYRATGCAKSTPLSDRHLQVNVCGFARSCFERALQGDYDFLEGVVMSHTCDTFCKLYDVWRYNVKKPFYYQLNTPHLTDLRAQHFFKEVLAVFVGELEKQFGCTVTEDDITRAIETHNAERLLLHKLNGLKKSRPPRIKASEMLSLTLAAMTMPKEESNRMLSDALQMLEVREPGEAGGGARLLVTGGPLDDTRLFVMLEELGAQVVSDDTCFGTRYFWDLVEPSVSPLEAIAKRYLEKVPCPCMHPGERIDHINRLIRDYRVDGVILYSLKYCDTHLHQVPELQKEITAGGVPTLFIESDHASIGGGQLTTRIQAFLELI